MVVSLSGRSGRKGEEGIVIPGSDIRQRKADENAGVTQE